MSVCIKSSEREDFNTENIDEKFSNLTPDLDKIKISEGEQKSEIKNDKLENSSEFVAKELVFVPDPDIKSLDLRVSYNTFIRARGCNGEDLIIEEYVKGYREIIKLFNLLGTILSFATVPIEALKTAKRVHFKVNSSDTTRIHCSSLAWINSVSSHLDGKDKDNFKTLRTAIKYEKSTKVNMKSTKSACSNVYRLHFFLYFIVRFLELLDTVNDNDRLVEISKKAYDETLAKVQGWFVVKTVHAGLLLMPTKGSVIEKAEKENYLVRQQINELLPKIIPLLKVLQRDTQDIFDECKTGQLF